MRFGGGASGDQNSATIQIEEKMQKSEQVVDGAAASEAHQEPDVQVIAQDASTEAAKPSNAPQAVTRWKVCVTNPNVDLTKVKVPQFYDVPVNQS